MIRSNTIYSLGMEALGDIVTCDLSTAVTASFEEHFSYFISKSPFEPLRTHCVVSLGKTLYTSSYQFQLSDQPSKTPDMADKC